MKRLHVKMLLLLYSNSHKDVNLPLASQQNISMDAVQGAMHLVGYENHKPYIRTPYLNPYQNFSALLGRNLKTQRYNYWCHIKTLCIINICYKYEISELSIFQEHNILVFLGV